MYTQSLLFALAGSAVASYTPQQLQRARDLEAGLQARQDVEDFEGCQLSLGSVAAALPTPTGELGSYLTSFYATADPTDPAVFCEITSAMPADLSSAYESYDRAASSWISEYVDVAERLSSVCGGEDTAASALDELVSIIESYTAEDCRGTFPTDALQLDSLLPIAGATPTGDNVPSETGSGNGNGNDSDNGSGDNQNDSNDSNNSDNSDDSDDPDDPSENGAARSTGVIAGAMALAGVIGAVAAL